MTAKGLPLNEVTIIIRAGHTQIKNITVSKFQRCCTKNVCLALDFHKIISYH